MTINTFAQLVAENRFNKKFTRPTTNLDRKLLMTVGEIVEAQNELRAGHAPGDIYYPDGTMTGKPEGLLIECADAVMRLIDVMYDVMECSSPTGAVPDIESVLMLKLRYNRTRPIRHGDAKEEW